MIDPIPLIVFPICQDLPFYLGSYSQIQKIGKRSVWDFLGSVPASIRDFLCVFVCVCVCVISQFLVQEMTTFN